MKYIKIFYNCKDDGEIVVVVAFYAEPDTSDIMGDAKFQFKMHDEEIFKINAFKGDKDSILNIESEKVQPTDIAAHLNFLYQYSKLMNIDDDIKTKKYNELNERMSKISGSSVLYGASKDYSGDRSKLCEIYGDSPLNMSAKELLNYYFDE